MIRKELPFSVLATGDGLSDRQIIVRATNGTQDRVDDIVVPKGCVLTRKSIPVLLDHKSNIDSLVGSADVTILPNEVKCLVTFIDKGISARADDACAKYKAGVGTDVSIGFSPIKVEPNGRGVKYVEWEFLELSLVVVGCNPDAVVTGKALDERGSVWKVGASRNLPAADVTEWNSEGAAKSIFDKAEFGGDHPNTTFVRKGFLVYNAADAENEASYCIPFATVVDDRLSVTAEGLKTAKSLLEQSEFPEDVAAKARAVLDHYEAKMVQASPIVNKKFTVNVKGLYGVAQLAMLLQDLGWIEECTEWESEIEGDNSPVPQMLADAMRAVADALLAMTQEEIAELLAEETAEGEAAVSKGLVTKDAKPIAKAIAAVRTKAGRKFSNETEKEIRSACKSISTGHDSLLSLVETPSDDQEETTSDTDKSAEALRQKRLREVDLMSLSAV
jgi:hypothetical protein